MGDYHPNESLQESMAWRNQSGFASNIGQSSCWKGATEFLRFLDVIFVWGQIILGNLLSGRYHPSAAYQRLHERRACGTNRESRRMVGQSSNWKPISGIHTILRDFRLGKQIIMGILLLGDYTNPLYLQESMAWWIQLRSHVWGRTEFSLKSLSSRIHIRISGMTFWRSQYIILVYYTFVSFCLSFSILSFLSIVFNCNWRRN